MKDLKGGGEFPKIENVNLESLTAAATETIQKARQSRLEYEELISKKVLEHDKCIEEEQLVISQLEEAEATLAQLETVKAANELTGDEPIFEQLNQAVEQLKNLHQQLNTKIGNIAGMPDVLNKLHKNALAEDDDINKTELSKKLRQEIDQEAISLKQEVATFIEQYEQEYQRQNKIPYVTENAIERVFDNQLRGLPDWDGERRGKLRKLGESFRKGEKLLTPAELESELKRLRPKTPFGPIGQKAVKKVFDGLLSGMGELTDLQKCLLDRRESESKIQALLDDNFNGLKAKHDLLKDKIEKLREMKGTHSADDSLLLFRIFTNPDKYGYHSSFGDLLKEYYQRISGEK